MSTPSSTTLFRRALRAIVGLLAVAFVASAITVATPSTASAGTPDDEQLFVELINQLRQSKGLEPLAVDNQLVGGARSWTAQIQQDGQLSHAGDLSIGVSANWSKLGENVGVAMQGQTQQLFDAFVASPSHYANLIDPDFRYVGVAVSYDNDGRMWTTHRFMATFDSPPKLGTTTTTVQPLSTVAPTTTASAPAATLAPTTAAPAPTSTSVAPTTTTEKLDEVPDQLALVEFAVTTAPLAPQAVASIVLELEVAGI